MESPKNLEPTKETIIAGVKSWFKEVIAINHVNNTKKLYNPKQFKINPFLVNYLARFLTGNSDSISIAKALIYPRVLSTSITTSFGQNTQKFISATLGQFGSAIKGVDIEFEDQRDGRKKYCQVKLGPSTINKDDVETIHNHFTSLRNIARTNNMKIQLDDLVVGVMYGEKSQLSANYKSLENKYHYPVYVGKEFWARLTGSEEFYLELATAISEVAVECDGTGILEETIIKLSQSDQIKEIAKK